MNSTRQEHWANLGESTFVAGIWLLLGIHRVLGRWPFRLCLYPVVSVHWLLNGIARRSSLEYLQRLQNAHQVFATAPNWRHSFRHFISFAETMLDKLLAMDGRYPLNRVVSHGRDALYDMIAAKRGAVILTAHIGCLELCRALGERDSGLKLNILVHTAHAEKFNRIVGKLNPESTVELVQVTDITPALAISLAEKIACGEFIVVTGDRAPIKSSAVASVPFLGAPAEVPTGPYILAALFKCPMFFMGCIRTTEFHSVYFRLLAECIELPRKEREQILQHYAALYVQQMESLLIKAPYEWFNFFPFWATEKMSRIPE